ncbi:proline-specific permease, partial [Fusarium proliferatum]
VQEPKIIKAEAQPTPALEAVESNRQERHIQLIALGGTIGTGLFVVSGATLAQSGPAPHLKPYIIMSILVWGVMRALGEMTSYMPIKGLIVPYLVNRFVDTSLAFATGWNYCLVYYMDHHVLVVILLLNINAVALFGESEFWFASIKIIAIIGLIFLGVVLFFEEALTTINWASNTGRIQNASIPVLNHILNGVILTSAWSSGNSMLYAGSRILYGCRGADIFNWLTTVITVSGLMNWNIVLVTYLRFRKAIFRNGIQDKLPYKAVFQPYLTYLSIVGMSLVCLTNVFAVFFPGNLKVATFTTSYISFPLFLAIYLGHKLFYDKGAWIRPGSDLDVFGEPEEVEEITANDVPPVPRNFLEKVWLWIC